jgi:hypothetical protein
LPGILFEKVTKQRGGPPGLKLPDPVTPVNPGFALLHKRYAEIPNGIERIHVPEVKLVNIRNDSQLLAANR